MKKLKETRLLGLKQYQPITKHLRNREDIIRDLVNRESLQLYPEPDSLIPEDTVVKVEFTPITLLAFLSSLLP